MERIMECFHRWRTGIVFTFAQSPKHIGFYQKYGFYPRFLTAIMSKPVEPCGRAPGWTKLSDVPATERTAVLGRLPRTYRCNLRRAGRGDEIRAVANQKLGDTILLWKASKLAGLAVCHLGAGTEAGSDVCYVKFGAARPGQMTQHDFGRLLDACEQFAASQNLSRLAAGANTARHEAYRQMLTRGFRTNLLGVAMEKPNDAGYNRPDIFLVDDWRSLPRSNARGQSRAWIG